MNKELIPTVIQTTITMEELGELTQALGKYIRFLTCDETLRNDINEIYTMMVEEIADVELCINKFKKINHIDDFELEIIKEAKEERLR